LIDCIYNNVGKLYYNILRIECKVLFLWDNLVGWIIGCCYGIIWKVVFVGLL